MLPERSEIKDNWKQVIKYCKYCNKRLVLNNARDLRRKKFCNRSCKIKHVYQIRKNRGDFKGKIKLKCNTCGKIYEAWPSSLKNYNNGKESLNNYCSRECFKNKPKQDWIENGYYRRTDKITGEIKLLHRIIAEKILGRPLKNGEIVHHINMDRLDNRNENLLICDWKYHRWLHARYAKRFAELHLGDNRIAA